MSDAVDGLLRDVDRYGRLTVSLNGLQIFGEAVRGRACGSCTACCTQVPVALPDEHKPANVRCKHLRSKGCGIYANRPRPCVAWSCRWLFDEDTAELRRPDQAGYVIDCAPDTVLATDEETGKRRPINVVQIWCDPKRPDAHRDAALRAYLDRLAERHRMMVIVRWSEGAGLVLMPPSMNTSGEWIELPSSQVSTEELATKLEQVGIESRFIMGGA